MENGMIHLAKITVENIKKTGKIILTEEIIIKAMLEAVAKEEKMAFQILNSAQNQRSFCNVISDLAWDKAQK